MFSLLRHLQRHPRYAAQGAAVRPAVTFGLPASSKGAAVRPAATFGLSASSDRRLQVGWPLCIVGLGVFLAAGSELKCPQGSVGIGARRRSGQAFGFAQASRPVGRSRAMRYGVSEPSALNRATGRPETMKPWIQELIKRHWPFRFEGCLGLLGSLCSIAQALSVKVCIVWLCNQCAQRTSVKNEPSRCPGSQDRALSLGAMSQKHQSTHSATGFCGLQRIAKLP